MTSKKTRITAVGLIGLLFTFTAPLTANAADNARRESNHLSTSVSSALTHATTVSQHITSLRGQYPGTSAQDLVDRALSSTQAATDLTTAALQSFSAQDPIKLQQTKEGLLSAHTALLAARAELNYSITQAPQTQSSEQDKLQVLLDLLTDLDTFLSGDNN